MLNTAINASERASGTDKRRVLVGYDGSPVALAALRYGAERVRGGADGSELIIAQSYSPPPEWHGTPYYESHIVHQQHYARELFEELPDDLLDGVHVVRELMEGPPARELAELADARDADEIVVGSRGFGPLRATLGSVSHALLHEANRPVVVVPARMIEAEFSPRTAHRIVVGYDGSPSAHDAIAHAAHRATPAGTLVVVYAFQAPFEGYNNAFGAEALKQQEHLAQRTLDEIPPELLAGVSVEQRIVAAPVADALVSAGIAEKASEIVVGSRGLGRFAAAVGSSSHALLYEVDRPVVVVPHELTAVEQEEAARVKRARSLSARHTLRL